MADALRVQLNIRQNAEELHDILKDLDSWQDEVKTKDEELRHSKIVAKKVWFSILFLELTLVCNKCTVDLRICGIFKVNYLVTIIMIDS